MFVSRRGVIGGLVVVVCLGLLALTFKSGSFLAPQGPSELLVISEEPSTSHNKLKVKVEPSPEEVETGSSPEATDSDQDGEEGPTVDLAASSEQPSSTLHPRGWEPPNHPHKIPDSFEHLQKTEDILRFVKSQCRKYNMTTAEPGEAKKPRMLIIPKNWKEHMIMYSSNPKTGSTSFKKWYTRIQGDPRPYDEITGVHVMRKYGNIEEAWDYAKSKSDHPESVTLAEMSEPFFKVGFMRNPLTRIISAFRDKVLRRTEAGIKGNMVEYNPALTAESSESEKFAAFVEGAVKGTINNFHWTPQWQKMKICDFPYDLLAQTETTSQQIREVQAASHTEQFQFPGSRSDGGLDSVATVELAHHFYENVRPEIMDMLYQFYKWDFVLMGYSKLSNPNFPYLDFNQDFEKEFGPLNAIAEESSTEPPEVTKPRGR